MGLDYNEYTSLHSEARSYRYGSYWNIEQYLLLVTKPVLHIHYVVEECEILSWRFRLQGFMDYEKHSYWLRRRTGVL